MQFALCLPVKNLHTKVRVQKMVIQDRLGKAERSQLCLNRVVAHVFEPSLTVLYSINTRVAKSLDYVILFYNTRTQTITLRELIRHVSLPIIDRRSA